MDRIETARLVLRPWCNDDLDAFHAIFGDREVIFWGSFDRTTSERKLRAVVNAAAPPLAWWAIEVDRTVVGNLLVQHSNAIGGIEIGWHVARAHQRRGYAKEAARATLDRLLPIYRNVYAPILPTNVASRALATALGMTRQGTILHADLEHELWVAAAQ